MYNAHSAVIQNEHGHDCKMNSYFIVVRVFVFLVNYRGSSEISMIQYLPMSVTDSFVTFQFSLPKRSFTRPIDVYTKMVVIQYRSILLILTIITIKVWGI